MFWLLLEQNQEVQNNIKTYKQRYTEKTELGGHFVGLGGDGSLGGGVLQGSVASGSGSNHLNSANHLQRRQNNNLRSSSGINTASPKVNAGGSSHNVFSVRDQKGLDGSVRRTL